MKKEEIIKIIENLETEIEKFSKKVENELKTERKNLQDILQVINKIGKSWSNSWMGYHADLYYNDFQCPPIGERFNSEYGLTHRNQPGWNEKTKEDVINVINREYSGPTAEEISENIQKCGIDELETLYLNISSNLSFIRSFDNFDTEINMLDNLEKSLSFQEPEDIVNKKTPRHVYSRDTTAGTQGLRVAPHIQCEANILSFISAIDAVENFIHNSKRLLKQVKVRVNAGDFEKVNVSKDNKISTSHLLPLIIIFFAAAGAVFTLSTKLLNYASILVDIGILLVIIAFLILGYVIIFRLLSFHLVRY